MKNKFLKSGKHVLSIVVAFAVLAVSLFTVVPAININADAAVTATDTWDGTLADGFASGTGTEGDPYIIETPEQLAFLAKTAGSSATNNTVGKYFKVAANQVFDMGGLEGITLDSTLADVQAATATNKNWHATFSNAGYTDGTKAGFRGNFDGNGLIVYNLYGAGHAAALFPVVDAGAVIKNVTVKNSRLLDNKASTNLAAGGIAGYHHHTAGNAVTIDGCTVENCQIESDGTLGAGSIAGCARYMSVSVSNCASINNYLSAPSGTTGVVGQANSGGISVSNTLVVGSAVAPATNPGTYTSVYTDQTVSVSGVTTVAAENMVGTAAQTNMPALNWGITWATQADGYPTPIFGVSYWDGTLATGFAGGTGAETDPFIIETEEQLAYLAKGADGQTAGKYYKIADGIESFNMAGMPGITLDSTLADVKAAAKTGANWKATVNNSNPFRGIFDGNGVVIYNIYCAGSWSAGLFPCINGTVDGGIESLNPEAENYNDMPDVTIKNVTVKNSWFESNSGQYTFGAGAIYGAHMNTSRTGTLVENTAVENCYIKSGKKDNDTSRAAGAIGGCNVSETLTKYKNCLVKGNEIVSGITETTGGLIGGGNGVLQVTDCVVLGTTPYPTGTAVNANHTTASNFKNVYTDQLVSESTYAPEQIKYLADMSGVAGKDAMSLDFDKIWFANTSGAPVLRLFHALSAESVGEEGHSESCSDCGLVGAAVSAHVYEDGVCACGYECAHADKEWVVTTESDSCTVADKGYMQCTVCGVKEAEKDDPEAQLGHKLTKTSDGFAADCGNDGELPYWTCSECEGIFLTDDAMSNDVKTLEDTVISASGAHTPKKTSNDEIMYDMHTPGFHKMICDVCGDLYGDEEHKGTYVPVGASGHTGACSVCGYETGDGSVEAHVFGDDSICDTCDWVCENHTAADGDVKQAGDCTTDKITAQYCSICETDLADKVEAAPGHTLSAVSKVDETCTENGTKAHDKCSVCDKLFIDGTEVTEAELVITAPGHSYEDLDENGDPVWAYDTVAHWYNCAECGEADYTIHTFIDNETDYEGIYTTCEDGCGFETFTHVKVNDDETVGIIATPDAFPKEVWTEINEIIDEDEIYADIEELLKSEKPAGFIAYDITSDEEFAEGGSVVITMLVPEEFGEDVAIYYIDVENGEIVALETEVIEDEETGERAAMAITEHYSVYALVDLTEQTAEGEGDNAGDEGGDSTGTDAGSNAGTGSTGNNNTAGNNNTGTTSPATSSDSVAAAAVLATLSAAAIVFARKMKRA